MPLNKGTNQTNQLGQLDEQIHQVKVDLGVMTMTGYYALSRSPELEPHHRMQHNVIDRTRLFMRFLPIYLGYNQRIIRPIDRA